MTNNAPTEQPLLPIKIGKFDGEQADLFAKFSDGWGRIGWVESELICTFSGSMASGDEYRIGHYTANLFSPDDAQGEVTVDLFFAGRRLLRRYTAVQAKRILKRRVAKAIAHCPAAYRAPIL